MTRVKGGPTTRRRHKKILKQAKGYRATRHKLYRRAKQTLIKALSYAYRHRRERKGDFRRLWIQRINAAARLEGLSYSRFIHSINKQGIKINRKLLAHIAATDPSTFSQLVSKAKEAINAGTASKP